MHCANAQDQVMGNVGCVNGKAGKEAQSLMHRAHPHDQMIRHADNLKWRVGKET